jgi:anti-sigma B factor antagonist
LISHYQYYKITHEHASVTLAVICCSFGKEIVFMSTTHGSQWLEREDFDTVTVVRLKTPKVVDDDTMRAVFEPIYTLCDIGRTRLVLNLAPVEYLPSMSLGKLVMLNRKVQAGNGRLVLCNLSRTIQNLLDTTHISELFPFYATEQEALQSFS